MAIDYEKGMRPNLYELMQGGGGGGGYVLPTASADTLGGVKIGEGVDVAEDGTISVDVPSPTDIYTKSEIDEMQAAQDEQISANATAISTETAAREGADTNLANNIPQLQIVTGTIDDVEVAAGTRKMNTISPNVPSDFNIVAIRRAKISNATNSGANSTHCVVQDWATAGGGTQVQIPVVNVGSNAAKIKIEVDALVMKIGL